MHVLIYLGFLVGWRWTVNVWLSLLFLNNRNWMCNHYNKNPMICQEKFSLNEYRFITITIFKTVEGLHNTPGKVDKKWEGGGYSIFYLKDLFLNIKSYKCDVISYWKQCDFKNLMFRKRFFVTKYKIILIFDAFKVIRMAPSPPFVPLAPCGSDGKIIK